MNIQKGLWFYLTLFFILSLVFFPKGKVSNFINSLLGTFWQDTYFTKADWNLILLCIIIAFLIKLLKGGSNGTSAHHQ